MTTVTRIKNDSLVLKSTAAAGIKIDMNSESFGYADLKGHKTTPTQGQVAPTRTQFRTGVYAPGYDQGDYIDWEYHLEHGDMIGETYHEHIHIKIPEGCVASGANLVITCVTAVFFHNRTGAPDPITKVFTLTPAQVNAVPKGTIIPLEILIAQAGGDDVTTFNSSNWRIDDDLISSLTLTTIPTLTGGLGQYIGLSHHDFHRKVNGIGATKYREMATTGSFHGTT